LEKKPMSDYYGAMTSPHGSVLADACRFFGESA
jgi:hypothetical protein